MLCCEPNNLVLYLLIYYKENYILIFFKTHYPLVRVLYPYLCIILPDTYKLQCGRFLVLRDQTKTDASLPELHMADALFLRFIFNSQQ